MRLAEIGASRMTDRPIIFSAPVVRALLDGRKTMTRRLAFRNVTAKSLWHRVERGDRLWVREAFNIFGGGDPGTIVWAADWRENAKARGLDNIPTAEPKWKPSIHMPRWGSRITLAVTAVKIEPIQAITEAEAMAEGIQKIKERDYQASDEIRATDAVGAFAALWWSLHGIGSWQNNPQVVALTFTVERRNIDARAAAT